MVAATEQNGQHDGRGGTRLDNRFGMDMYVESGKLFSEQASIDCRIVAIGHERRTRSSREQPVKSAIDCHGQLLWLYVVVICRGHMRWLIAVSMRIPQRLHGQLGPGSRSRCISCWQFAFLRCRIALRLLCRTVVLHRRVVLPRCIFALHCRTTLSHCIAASHYRATLSRHIVGTPERDVMVNE
jgi:hypothetical protein